MGFLREGGWFTEDFFTRKEDYPTQAHEFLNKVFVFDFQCPILYPRSVPFKVLCIFG